MQRYGAPALERRKRKLENGGYPISKWILFCEEMHLRGLETWVSEAVTTRSKYVHVMKDDKMFKVRFSNHAPNRVVESKKDSDFYVGIANFGTTTTHDAIQAVEKFFGVSLKKEWLE